MKHPDTATTRQLRDTLLERIDAYKAATAASDAKIGTDAVKDHKIIARIRAGGGCTVKMYGRLMDWLEEQMKAAA